MEIRRKVRYGPGQGCWHLPAWLRSLLLAGGLLAAMVVTPVAAAATLTGALALDTPTSVRLTLPSVEGAPLLRVYVVHDEIVTGLQPEIAGLLAAPSGSAPAGEGSGVTRVTAGVMPWRLLVVDEGGRITEVWSNTAGTAPFYVLGAMKGEIGGPAVPVTQELLGQYSRLLRSVDWSVTGRAYQSSPA
ncbi:MAG: hypothetical protein HYY00_00800 [Chloroflexi bacterium]|nr:hypothetical protein [Chloroflexota bacterium]